MPPRWAVARLALGFGRSHTPLASRALDAPEAWLPALTWRGARRDHCGVAAGDAPDASVAAGGVHAPDSRRPWELTPLPHRRTLQLVGSLAAAGLVDDRSGAKLAWSRQDVLELDVLLTNVKSGLWAPSLPSPVTGGDRSAVFQPACRPPASSQSRSAGVAQQVSRVQYAQSAQLLRHQRLVLGSQHLGRHQADRAAGSAFPRQRAATEFRMLSAPSLPRSDVPRHLIKHRKAQF